MSENNSVTNDFLLDNALEFMVSKGASDLHLTNEAPPKIRVDGSLRSVGSRNMTAEMLKKALYRIISEEQKEQFEKEEELDFAYEIPKAGRFRVNYYIQKGSIGAVFRHISTEIKSLESLGLPSAVARFAEMPRGLVLVTGPTGSGKSTTLAAIVDLVNRNRACHIMTIEDPIEYIHHHKKAIVNQREVGADTKSFGSALKHVLRQDPDVILVGELRDLETISIALTAAETGHLVFATLHTQDTVQSIDRIIDVFPPSQQMQIRTQLAASLQGVVCQALLPKLSPLKGRAVATEVMFINSAIANMIRDAKAAQIYTYLQAGKSDGMHTMDQSLAELVNSRQISYETALSGIHDRKGFDLLVNQSLRFGSSDRDHKDWSDMSSVPYDDFGR